MAVPMVDEDKVMGIVYLDTQDPAQRFDEETLKVVATFGNILAAKITNHNLLIERTQRKLLEDELRRASQIQEALMPKTLPTLPGYQLQAFQMQCKMVGGDLYDIAPLPDGRMLLLLADVSGKGMGAALQASNILSAYKILRGMDTFDIATATARVSDHLASTSSGGDFATVFVAALDPTTHVFEFVNAGHNPPILIKADGTHQLLDSTGIPIGVFAGFSWSKNSITLDSGDRIIIFTDGIPEATDAGGNLYSDERLEAFVVERRLDAIAALTTALISDVSKFVGEAPRSDDITLVCLERQP
jgi:sigma-B regulation protein RsbU (phosphoserine phosphatase)